jgi:2-succinyl-5-enolpyruvyl-6-hydroxy-3-cyclohexene-1-carboxylate synthase
VAALAAVSGWPVLAEPTSGLRCGRHDRSHVISHYDALLRAEAWAAGSSPDLVLRIGDVPTSKPLRAWLASAPQVVVDPHGAWHEPTRRARLMVRASAAAMCTAVALELSAGGLPLSPDGAWLERWRTADALVAPALDQAPDPFEPKVYAALADVLPDDSIVWVSSSMPIRDVESFFPSIETGVRFLANRGANGIDGVTSSAAGAALASPGRRVFLLTGELALLHDLGGLIAAQRAGAELTIVCVNNGGGGIFDFLPVAAHAEKSIYEEHVATPASVHLEDVAALVRMQHTLASTPDEVRAAVAKPGLVEVRTDRAANVAEHRALFERVARALS